MDDDRGNRRQKYAWYAITLIAVISIALLNDDRAIVSLPDPAPETNDIAMGSVGRMTPKQPKPIQQISILGERNSGTRWLYE